MDGGNAVLTAGSASLFNFRLYADDLREFREKHQIVW
jgi:hypothetical protein